MLDFDYESNMKYMLTNAVWDISTGYVLKLGQNKLITHALYGFNKVTKNQLIEAYGDPPVFSKF